MSRLRALLLLHVVLAGASAGDALPIVPGDTVAERLVVHGVVRTFLLRVPTRSAGPAPVVLALHALGSSGRAMVRCTGFEDFAERDGWIVAFPDAIDGAWLDPDRMDLDAPTVSDNVAFCAAIVDAVAATTAVDRRRVYATGYSAGAGLSIVLAARDHDRYAAIAPVCASLPVAASGLVAAWQPMPTLMIDGTADRIVPYAGGRLGVGGGDVQLLSVPDTAAAFAAADGCGASPTLDKLANRDWFDGCRVESRTWLGASPDAELQLLTIVGGGHTWPGARSWLPELLLGATCRDIDASAEIWAFFRRHARAVDDG